MLAGPNVSAMREMQQAVRLPVIASGGVTTADDVSKLAAAGLAGCIIGRSLYEGRITIRSARQNGQTVIDIIDNGVGVAHARAGRTGSSGIGLRNVNDRLRVIYGANYHLHLDSVPGEGTCARIVIPELSAPARIA